ncbi:phytoene desaturase family protein [Arthrobacter burdickii]|uniref:Phytoene desaturase family protein n=1 Tax=Arthrobacter burdickii TaxID=3035920 RepID=A0ABT8JZW5_9MICC|nr:phytoene desaturase family protein [Arthrobacter burdickii]MDN4610720.1 phytoene desaturase family protein [Arthrobacter burdickii]
MTPQQSGRIRVAAKDVVVIGGGIGGLATSALLAREGHSVTLLEKRGQVGGRAGSWEQGGFRFDTGPSWYLMPEVIDHFFRLMGTSAAEQLDLVKLDPGYRVVFEEGGAVDVPADREAVTKLFESLEAGAGEQLSKYLDSAEDAYEIAKKRFLYSTFQSFLPFVRPDVLARLPRIASLLLQPLQSFVEKRFQDPRIQQILGYPAVFLGSSPFDAPSMYHLMSHLDLDDGVLYPMGGFSTLIDGMRRVAVAAGVEIRTDADVVSIDTEPRTPGRSPLDRRAATVRGVTYRTNGTTTSIGADIVVSAADLHHTETTMLPADLQTYPEGYWQKRVPGPSALLLYLGVRGSLPQLEHHTLLFTTDWRDNFGRIFGKETSVPSPASLYVCRPSATDGSVAPAGHENVFVLVPIPADVTIGRGGLERGGDARVEDLADAVIGQISEWAGIPDLAERIVVRRSYGPQDFADDLNAWRGTSLGPAHILKQSAFFRGSNRSAKVGNLFYAGSSTVPGIGIPMCLISAELIVKRLRGDTSTGPLPEPAAG